MVISSAPRVPHLVRLGGVLQVDGGDEPALRGTVGRPQRVVKTLSLGARQNLERAGTGDLIDEPKTAPILQLHIRTQQNRLVPVPPRGRIHRDEVLSGGQRKSEHEST